MLEAKPFVTAMGLKKIGSRPFQIFETKKTILIISDIGKANAAIAATYACHRYFPAFVVNMGAAGAASSSCSLGKSFQVSRIIEYDRPDFRSGNPVIHTPDTLDGFQDASLATSDTAVLAADLRKEISVHADLVDMEGASIVQACRKFDAPCYLFKFVSDTPEHSTSDDIVTNIRKYRNPFCDFFLENVMARL